MPTDNSEPKLFSAGMEIRLKTALELGPANAYLILRNYDWYTDHMDKTFVCTRHTRDRFDVVDTFGWGWNPSWFVPITTPKYKRERIKPSRVKRERVSPDRGLVDCGYPH